MQVFINLIENSISLSPKKSKNKNSNMLSMFAFSHNVQTAHQQPTAQQHENIPAEQKAPGSQYCSIFKQSFPKGHFFNFYTPYK